MKWTKGFVAALVATGLLASQPAAAAARAGSINDQTEEIAGENIGLLAFSGFLVAALVAFSTVLFDDEYDEPESP